MARAVASDPLKGKEPGYRVLDPEGLNGGPPPDQLGVEELTPVGRFFSRNHAPIPHIDPERWRLAVRGLVRQELTLSLEELRRTFRRHEVPATLVCAGLRRAELVRHRPVPGELVWDLEPAGTAVWGGVALRDVLLAAGVRDAAAHVGLTGLDEVERGGTTFGFGGSVPREKALEPEVLLAYEMNGQPLPALHGGPVRLVVPGYIGARSVKWMAEIELLAEPSANYFQVAAYRVLQEPDPADPRDVRAGEALGEVALNAVILAPEQGSRLPAGDVTVRGWAMDGRSPVRRVEVSPDGCRTWIGADLEAAKGRWSWQRWTARVTLPPGPAVLIARAWNEAGEGQPESIAEVWNAKGYANNAWHRVAVEIEAGAKSARLFPG
ncbi:MAG: sulfite oxidase [Gemmatimonadota bacterium]|nr:sulfite oxidase [Gemmatimonadota bacterium]